MGVSEIKYKDELGIMLR